MLGQGEGDMRSAMVIPRDTNISHRKGCSHATAVSTLVAQRNVEGHGGKWVKGNKFGLGDLGVVELSYLILALGVIFLHDSLRSGFQKH